MAIMVGQIQALITADKSQYSRTLNVAESEHREFVGKTGKTKAQIDGDERGFVASTKRATESAGTMRTKVSEAAQNMRSSLAGVVAGAGIIEGFRKIVMAASDLEESSNVVQVTFKSAAKTIFDFAAGASKSIGMSNLEARQAAGTFGAYGKMAGLANEANAQFSIGLAKLAADLASFKNTSPAEAIEAIGAAFRGENDPIEKYGVILNETLIQQQALTMGIIETTSQALTPQQRVLVVHKAILDQTKDAQGDFARTSDSLANRLKTLKASVIDQAAAMGQSLLPAAKSVVGFLQGPGMSVFGAIGDVLGVIVSGLGVAAHAFGAMPGPIQAAVIALVAWRLAQSSVMSLVDGARSRIQGMTSSVQEHGSVLGALRSRFSTIDDMAASYGRASAATQSWIAGQHQLTAASGPVMGTLRGMAPAFSGIASAATGAAAAIGTGMKNAALGLVNFLGGPWGIAMAAGAIALGVWTSRQQAAKQAAEAHAAKVKSLTQELVVNKGVLTAQTKAQMVQEAQSKGLYDAARRMGVSQRTMTEAILGSAEAIRVVDAAWDKFGIGAYETSASAAKLKETFDGIRRPPDLDKWVTLTDVLGHMRRDFGSMTSSMIETNEDAKGVGLRLAEVGVSADDLSGSVAATDKPLSGMAAAVALLGKQGATTEDRISALKDAILGLSGTQIPLDDAMQHLNDTLRDLGTSFKDARAESRKAHVGFLTASGGINTATEAGSKLHSQLTDLRDAQADVMAATLATADANGNITPANAAKASIAMLDIQAKLKAATKDAKLNADEVRTLSEHYLGLPKDVATKIQQPGMLKAIVDAIGLKDKITAVPNAKSITVSSTSAEQIAMLEALGYKVTHLPNGQIRIDGDISPAEQRLAALMARIRNSSATVAVGIATASSLRGVNVPQASGQIMEYYAQGGLRPMSGANAAIVQSYSKTGVQRVIGDNPRFPELFAPLDRASARSQALIDEALKIMRPEWFQGGGQAAGGYVASSPASSGGGYVDRSITLHAVPSVPTLQQLRDLQHEQEVLHGRP